MAIGFRKHHKALLEFTAKEDRRPVLTGVYVDIEKGTAVSCDGFKMIVMPLASMSDDDYPAVASQGGPAKTHILPGRGLADGIKNLVKSKALSHITEFLRLSGNGNGKVVMSSTDLQGMREAAIEPLAGTYPNYSQLIPDKLPRDQATIIGVGPDHLIAACKAAKEMGCNILRFQITQPSVPIRVEFLTTDMGGNKVPNDNGEGVVAVVMPMFLRD